MRRENLLHYFVLFCILGGGVGAFYYVRPNVTLQLIVGIVTSVSYVLWGVIHHTLEKDLHHKIVIEYMLIGAIAIALLVTILGF